jgi:hypothetical protein
LIEVHTHTLGKDRENREKAGKNQGKTREKPR